MNEVYQSLLGQGYTPEQIELIMELGVYPEQMERVSREQALADQLRTAPSARGRHVGQGRVFVGASPLEHLGVLGQRIGGQIRTNQLDEKADDILNEQVRRRMEFLRGGPKFTPPAGPPNRGMGGL